ncbi:MAG: 4-hydroxy-tetrahydrodipicolinate reductase [Candidatus Eisenbacteria bacterium]
MIELVVHGAAGRMGRAVALAAQGATDLRVVAHVDPSSNLASDAGAWTTDLASALRPGQVVVEFSGPSGARHAAELCAAKGAALVSGSTGLGADEEAALQAAATRVAVFRASNFSIGVAVLRRALLAALEAAPNTWDIEIVERHHRMKQDSPSGTALTLADDALGARGLTRDALVNGRAGAVGMRPAAEIGLHAVRGGTWVGDHQVLLAGEGEWIELRHVAQDRAAFAHGALSAARFLSTAAPGMYTMHDLVRGPGRT